MKKKRIDGKWCAPEHYKKNCSWKGEGLAASNYGGRLNRNVQRLSSEEIDTLAKIQCGVDANHPIVFHDETMHCNRKRYLNNGLIMEWRW